MKMNADTLQDDYDYDAYEFQCAHREFLRSDKFADLCAKAFDESKVEFCHISFDDNSYIYSEDFKYFEITARARLNVKADVDDDCYEYKIICEYHFVYDLNFNFIVVNRDVSDIYVEHNDRETKLEIRDEEDENITQHFNDTVKELIDEELITSCYLNYYDELCAECFEELVEKAKERLV